MIADLFDRTKTLLLNPRAHWEESLADPGDLRSLLVPNALLLAAIPTAAAFVGHVLASLSYLSPLLVVGLLLSLALTYATQIGLWVLLGLLIDAFAAPFGAQRDQSQSMKLAYGAIVPVWLAGAVGVIPLPGLVLLATVVGLGYGCYLLYLGLPLLNGTDPDRAAAYTAAVMAILLVVAMVVFSVVGCVRGCAAATSAWTGA